MSNLYKNRSLCRYRTHNFKKSFRHIEHEKQEDEFTLGSVTESETTGSDCIGEVHDKEDLWHARIITLGKPATYRVDTGADVTVVPHRFSRKILPKSRKQKKNLYGLGQNELQLKGIVHATLSTEKTASDQDLHVVTNLNEPL